MTFKFTEPGYVRRRDGKVVYYVGENKQSKGLYRYVVTADPNHSTLFHSMAVNGRLFVSREDDFDIIEYLGPEKPVE